MLGASPLLVAIRKKELHLSMESLLYIAGIIALAAIVFLVVFVIITIRSAKQTMDQVSGTLGNLEQQVSGITTEANELLEKTNQLTNDMQSKSAKLDGLFEGAQQFGQTASHLNQSFDQVAAQVTQSASENKEQINQAVTWGTAAIDLIKKIKK
ncbi:DUF948 domain-containing protein [Ornithinibacillus gellani]|nr:DUF948 domain-containing protein [Ornithinibacillus gellani]